MENPINLGKKALLACLFSALSLVAIAQGTISGNVTDSDALPLPGASVFVDGTTLGTTTDVEGAYSFDAPAGTHTLVVSFIGFATQELEVTVTDGQTSTHDFVLATDNLALDGVVVTGSFSARTQKDSPISMTVLSPKQIQRLATSSQADILRTIPGITAEGGGGEVASNVFVRGLPSGGQYQFTPLQIDGMPVIAAFGLNSSAHDVYFRNDIGIRNLEFIRGGSSTLFGAGSVAGIVNYSSITGSANSQNIIQIEGAQGGRAKLDFLSAGAVSDDLFYAISGFYRYDEGPLETGLVTSGYQIRGNLKRTFNDGLSSFTAYAQVIDDNVQFYLPYPLANDAGQKERPNGNDGETVYTLLTGQATDYSFDTPYGRFESPIGNGVITEGGFFMADLKHNFADNWYLTSKVKAAKYNHWFNLFLDGDGSHNTPETQDEYLADRGLPADAAFTYVDNGVELAAGDLLFENRILDRHRPMEEMVGEINLTRNSDSHNITFGSFVSSTRADDNNWILNYLGDFRNAPRVVSVDYQDSTGADVAYSTGGFISGSQIANKHHVSTKVAVYLADEYKGESFDFDIGLRWERAHGLINRENGVGTNNFQKGEVSASDFAVSLAGLYRVSEDFNVYANASKGYFFPELRGVKFPLPGKTLSYETEGIIQGELGAKFKSEKLSATGAFYYVTLSDRRSIDFINDPANPGGIIEEVRVQSTRTFGTELSLNYIIMKGLVANANMTLQKHEFTKVEGNEDQVGNSLRRQPNIMGSIGLDYQVADFDANISSTFTGKKFANDGNTVELDAINILRVDAGYKFSLGDTESVRLGLTVFNLLDAAGITEGSPRQGSTQVAGGNYFVGRPILPRRVFLKATFNF